MPIGKLRGNAFANRPGSLNGAGSSEIRGQPYCGAARFCASFNACPSGSSSTVAASMQPRDVELAKCSVAMQSSSSTSSANWSTSTSSEESEMKPLILCVAHQSTNVCTVRRPSSWSARALNGSIAAAVAPSCFNFSRADFASSCIIDTSRL